jgi:hypothetical protein
MLVRWWWCIGIGALLGWQQLRDSGDFPRQCFWFVAISALVGRWHCHGIGAGTLVSKGRDLTINFRGGRRGEGGSQYDEQHVKGAVAFWGDAVVHREVLLGGGQPCDGRRARGQWHSGGCCNA